MSVASARALAATLGGKAPGHLITSEHWNQLVSVLLEYGIAPPGPAMADGAVPIRIVGRRQAGARRGRHGTKRKHHPLRWSASERARGST